MPSQRPAQSSPEAPTVLVAGLSARALAAAARRAGFRALAVDLFGDQDTRALAWRSRRVAGSIGTGFDGAALIESLDRLSAEAGDTPLGLVAGAGLEARPELLARLDARYGLVGNGADQVRRVKDPASFFSLLARLSIPHPETRFNPPPTRRGWLTKRIGASGGGHVKALGDRANGAEHYFQRRVRGRPISACFLADGQRTRLLGFSKQWAAPAGPRAPFRFGGLAQPAELPDGQASEMAEVVARLVPEIGLRGLNSADFLVRARSFDLLEINPRPGASLDIFDRVLEAPLFRLHCEASAGTLPDGWPTASEAMASAVVYANRRLVVPAEHRWPAWTADRPPRGQLVERGDPLCSVLAKGRSAAEAGALVNARARKILHAMKPPPRQRQPVAGREVVAR
ncbi:MAG: ATP-grasp domain-containing protein [Pseudomonadota bacterium]